MKLPDWNDLKNETREKIVDEARYHCCHCMSPAQVAVDIYDIVREALSRPEVDLTGEPLELPQRFRGPTYDGVVR